jgi:hypothetical protein
MRGLASPFLLPYFRFFSFSLLVDSSELWARRAFPFFFFFFSFLNCTATLSEFFLPIFIFLTKKPGGAERRLPIAMGGLPPFPKPNSFVLFLYVLWEPLVGSDRLELYISGGSEIWAVTFSKGWLVGIGMGWAGY